ncbi:tyrosine-type recombinase/integrase [Saccharothrix sp. BKS2]|uniref:tyrosine-type recombinase/integrase n=1 Tax=Saccharothrix sp. BKS2 TaxID=3064400 RepID=UPI0039EA15C3
MLGLRWDEDVDFGTFAKVCGRHEVKWCVDCYVEGAATVYVQQARVLVEGKVLIVPPKSENGFRKLPLDLAAASALHTFKVKQAEEKLSVGEGYRQSGYVVADEAGEPVHPEWYSDEFGRLSKRAGVKRIVLHEGRHTALSLMGKAGVPISIVSKWAGHYDTAFTYSTYVHASDEDLHTGTEALGKLYG